MTMAMVKHKSPTKPMVCLHALVAAMANERVEPVAYLHVALYVT